MVKEFIGNRFQAYLRFDFFNPFKKRELGVIIPIFNFLPQLGILIDRVSRRIGLRLGWLNINIEFHVWLHSFKIFRRIFT